MTICIQSTFSSIIRPNTNTLCGPNRTLGTALMLRHQLTHTSITQWEGHTQVHIHKDTSTTHLPRKVKLHLCRLQCPQKYSVWPAKANENIILYSLEVTSHSVNFGLNFHSPVYSLEHAVRWLWPAPPKRLDTADLYCSWQKNFGHSGAKSLLPLTKQMLPMFSNFQKYR